MREVHYQVTKSGPIKGTVFIQGAKNATLPLIGAALMASAGDTVLRNVPIIDDVRRAVELARQVGARAELHEDERVLVIDASGVSSGLLPGKLTRLFRGSVLFIPALMHRAGHVRYEGVGGCNLGTRALDWHYRGFARLGAHVEEHDGVIDLKVDQLHGAELYLDTPSHTGTENLVMAACLAEGTTVIENTALEPEVLDVVACLTRMGAKISGAGTGRIIVEGVKKLHGIDYTVMPDRIDAGVFALAAAITGGDITLVGANLSDFGVVRFKLEQLGLELAASGAVVHVSRRNDLRPINIITDTHPGFATDLQSPLLATATQTDGVSWIHERVYDARFAVVPELVKMGADVRVTGETVAVHGPSVLHGADVVAHDLRTGVSLILAGLVAEGRTTISNGQMIERGHADIVRRLSGLGVNIERHAHVDG